MKTKRTFTQLVYAITDPSFKRVSKAEYRRMGIKFLTKNQLDSMFEDTCGTITRASYTNPFK